MDNPTPTTTPAENLARRLANPEPILALAPMQDVTDLRFWKLITAYEGADLYVTEYFRVHADSRPEKTLLRSIIHNPTGRPVLAQMIGNDVQALVRTARELQRHPVAGIDLNLGCPAPVVYRKCAGGGLLRDLPLVDRILGALREAVAGFLTVKTRLGFDSDATLDALLPLLLKHRVDLVTIHGRTVVQMYRPGVRLDRIAQAVRTLPCPVLANGDFTGAGSALHALATTGARGLMIGRGAIRNPWVFGEIRYALAGRPPRHPTGADLLRYIEALYEAVCDQGTREDSQVRRMKKYLGFIADGLGDTFRHRVLRASTRAELFAVCRERLEPHLPLPLPPAPSPEAPIHPPEPA